MSFQRAIVSSWRMTFHRVKIVWTVDGEGWMGLSQGVILMIEARSSAIFRHIYMALRMT